MIHECVQFKRIIEKSWPIAFAELVKPNCLIISSLFDHSIHTADLYSSLFKSRLKVLEEKTKQLYTWERGELLDFSRAVGAFHDVGKASSYYMEAMCRGSKPVVSFRHHEYIAALIALASMSTVEDRSLQLKMDLLAQVILRHHSAMKFREENINVRSLIEITSKIKDEYFEAMKRICGSHPLCMVLPDIKKVSKILNEKEFIVRKMKIQQGEVINLTNSERALKYIRHVAIQALTGFLVVADNLAAICERTIIGDIGESVRPHVRHWLRELGVGEYPKNAQSPQECVEAIIKFATKH